MITFLCDMKNKTFSFSGSPIQDCRRYKLFITVGLWISLWGIQVEISVTVHKMWLDANSPVLCLAPLSLLHYTVKESFYNVFWVKNDCFVYVRVSILRVGSAKSTTPLVSHVSVLMIVCEKAKKTKKTKQDCWWVLQQTVQPNVNKDTGRCLEQLRCYDMNTWQGGDGMSHLVAKCYWWHF